MDDEMLIMRPIKARKLAIASDSEDDESIVNGKKSSKALPTKMEHLNLDKKDHNVNNTNNTTTNGKHNVNKEDSHSKKNHAMSSKPPHNTNTTTNASSGNTNVKSSQSNSKPSQNNSTNKPNQSSGNVKSVQNEVKNPKINSSQAPANKESKGTNEASGEKSETIKNKNVDSIQNKSKSSGEHKTESMNEKTKSQQQQAQKKSQGECSSGVDGVKVTKDKPEQVKKEEAGTKGVSSVNKVSENKVKKVEAKVENTSSKVITKPESESSKTGVVKTEEKVSQNQTKTPGQQQQQQPKKKIIPKSEESSSETESEDDEDDDDDDDDEESESESEKEEAKPRKDQKTVQKSKELMKKVAKDSRSSTNNTSNGRTTLHKDTKPSLKTKESMVTDILRRWWYCMEDWPPRDIDYNERLKERGLRKVDLAVWKLAPEEDENGLKKVFEISGYPGLYKSETGQLFDVRPKETCPSHENLMKKSEKELISLLVNALKNQIQDLNHSGHIDKQLLKELQAELARAEKIHDNVHRRK